MKLIDESETVLYRLRKSKSPIIFLIFFVPIWLFFASIFLRPLYRSLFLGETALSPGEYWQAGLIGLLVFIPVLLLIILSYSLNQLVITDRRVYIRKGVPGRTHVISLGDIRSFQHGVAGKNRSNHAIHFYLFCGKKIKTGNLYITLGNLQALLGVLREKFEGRGFTSQEMKQLQHENSAAGEPQSRTNLVVLLILLAPWIMALALTLRYLSQ